MSAQDNSVQEIEKGVSTLDFVTINTVSPPEKILALGERRLVGFCYDGSDASKYAFEWSFKRIFLPYQDHVYIIVAQEAPSKMSASLIRKGLSGTREPDSADQIKKDAEGFSKDLIGIGITSQLITTTSDPRKYIPKAVEDLGIEALVIGSRGNNLARRVVFGSVSSYILNKVKCPVIVVKDPSIFDANAEETPLEKVNTRESLRLVRTISKDESPSIAIARSRNRDQNF
ncbi:hypothetical protein BB559_001941 [Furculomyces boomerangus]|uniref:UspA domain-containing protein n=2 Tax=Harpellales TaxID=61421 RepID=A0A2T9YZC7_9FUNG|nr:hypothetical protein BB559_002663 [Furculomyces boomerangus]PVU97644.1 hypothetical protein BB559_001941 [Furculomyces boomerangus]PWA02773.1 hypothetical protein BB558_001081 [Smittium angustum]